MVVHLKNFNSYPLNLYDCSSSTLKPTRYHYDHKENEGGQTGPKHLREMTQPASSLGVHGRDGYCAIWSMTMRTQSLALPDIARRPSGPPDIHSHSHSCTSPTTPTPTPSGRQYPHSWIGFTECFYFGLIKL